MMVYFVTVSFLSFHFFVKKNYFVTLIFGTFLLTWLHDRKNVFSCILRLLFHSIKDLLLFFLNESLMIKYRGTYFIKTFLSVGSFEFEQNNLLFVLGLRIAYLIFGLVLHFFFQIEFF